MRSACAFATCRLNVRPFSYSAPSTLDEAVSLLGSAARPLAGGTDLVTLMKADLVAPERLVSIRKLVPSGISEGADGFTLGAGTTLSEIERDARLRRQFTALSQAAALAASAQLRNMATLGGNLLQRPRCWYFRNPLVQCWLKGGADCPAREGENRLHALFAESPCVAVHPSDLAPALLAFDADVRLLGPDGERALALEKLFMFPEDARRSETRLSDDELILAVRMPSHPAETRSTYLKAMDRQAFAFALVGVAAVLRLSPERRVGHARLVLSGVAPIPRRAQAAERVLLGEEASERLFERAAEAAVEGAAPLRRNAYKLPLLRALIKRTLVATSN
jgi:xanthine dehydrogenase YagS FAD-binding subunit